MTQAHALPALKQAVQDALTLDRASPDVVARHIVDLLMPPQPHSIGSAFYKSSATGWLTQVLRASPKLELPELVRQVNGLCALSPKIGAELGALSGRLNLL